MPTTQRERKFSMSGWINVDYISNSRYLSTPPSSSSSLFGLFFINIERKEEKRLGFGSSSWSFSRKIKNKNPSVGLWPLSKSVVCQCVCSLCLLLHDRFLSLRSVYFSFRVDRIVSFRKARVENPVEWFFLKNFIGEIRKDFYKKKKNG